VLAIGGVGGLAVGLAGREILENLFTGLIILSSSPFEVGDEVLFTPPSGSVRPPTGCRRSLPSTAAKSEFL
jgi:small-conductance mechanosensitive channel